MNRWLRFALAGLQTGVTGALAVLSWLGFTSVLQGRGVCWVPNLFASVLYGSESIRPGCGRYTAAGIALDFAVYGFMGCAFGFAWRDQRGGARLLWVGMLVALITWYVVFRVIWKNASPVGALYAPDRQLFIGNLIYGFMLGRFPKAASRLSAFPRLS